MVAPMTFGTRTVAELARVTVRALQWWRELGMLEPTRVTHGDQALLVYDSRQTLAAMVVADLRQRGVALRELVKAAITLPADLDEPEFLVFDGKTFHDCAEAESALGIAVAQGPVWVVELEGKRRRMRIAGWKRR